MKAKIFLALMVASSEAISLTPNSALVAQKSNDISENQKKLFAHMQKKSGSEI